VKFIIKEKEREYEYPLSPGELVVGRSQGCDLTVDSRTVSKQHMSCIVRGESVSVRDLDSRNGVKVNGTRVRETELKDGDEVSIGDVSLVLSTQVGSGAAAQTVFSSDTTYADGARASQEPYSEDEEITPAEGSLVRVDPAQTHPGVYEREGHWYVSDPATGREVEIVPADRDKKDKIAGGSLLATKKGRMILGGAAAGVLLLFLLSLFFAGSPEPEIDRIPEGQFDNLIAQTLEALEDGEIETARTRARIILENRPGSGAAASLHELVDLWERHEENFLDNWVDVKRQLHDLLYNHESTDVRRFVRRHIARIDDSVLDYNKVEEAEELLSRGRYEDAYETLTDIDEDRPARRENVELLEDIRLRHRRHLQSRLQAAEDAGEWDAARTISQQLMDVFPDTVAELENRHEEYATLARHREILEAARADMEHGNYGRAVTRLDGIPEDSRYYQDAAPIIEDAQQSIQRRGELRVVERAREYFIDGEHEQALELLEQVDITEARRLAHNIQNVIEAYNAALEAESDREYARAGELWRRVIQLDREIEGASAYSGRAERELEGMPEKKRRYAEELVEKGDQKYIDSLYAEAREAYVMATTMDPDEAAGQDGLRRIRNRGVRQYHRALNETDPEEAIKWLKSALELLSSDDDYYRRAEDRLNVLRSELE